MLCDDPTEYLIRNQWKEKNHGVRSSNEGMQKATKAKNYKSKELQKGDALNRQSW